MIHTLLFVLLKYDPIYVVGNVQLDSWHGTHWPWQENSNFWPNILCQDCGESFYGINIKEILFCRFITFQWLLRCACSDHCNWLIKTGSKFYSSLSLLFYNWSVFWSTDWPTKKCKICKVQIHAKCKILESENKIYSVFAQFKSLHSFAISTDLSNVSLDGFSSFLRFLCGAFSSLLYYVIREGAKIVPV